MSDLFEDVGDALQRDPLYVHPDAESQLEAIDRPFDAAAQKSVRDRLDEADENIFIAVLPADVQTLAALDEVRRVAGEPGTYLAFFSNGQFDTTSDVHSPADVSDAALAAFDRSGTPERFFLGFIDRIEQLSEPAGGTSSGPGGALPLAILLGAGGGGFLLYRRNRRHRERAELDQVRTALDEDITAYGEELIALDVDVQSATEAIESRDEYARALDLYEMAKAAADHAEKPGHLRPVTASLEEGRWLLTRVQARRNGDAPPDRRQPCFFDPRHGPSIADVAWAPPGGVARGVPACAADIARIQDGYDPHTRMVDVGGGEKRPYWDAGPAYAAWAGGYYGAVLPAMLVGTMLGTNVAYAGAAGAAGGWGDGGGMDGGFDGGGFEGGFDGGFGGFDGGF